jgi:hypothetical protein
MLVSHQRVGLWWDDELTKTSANAIGGFITVTACSTFPNWMRWCVSRCERRCPELPCRTGSWYPSGWWRELAVVATRRSRCWPRCWRAS